MQVLATKMLETRSLHTKYIKGFIPSSLFSCNNLLNMYLKHGDLPSGLQLFDEMPDRNVVSWASVIAGFSQHGFHQQALSIFARMHRLEMKPNEFVFVSALQAASFSNSLHISYQTYSLVIKSGFESNTFLANAILKTLLRHKRFQEALYVFNNCRNKDVVSWNTMMNSVSKIPRFWYQMCREGVKPDEFTFATALTGLASLSNIEFGIQVHSQLVKSGYGDNRCVGDSLVEMYLESQNLFDSLKAFKETDCKDVGSWNQLAKGCINCGEPSKALQFIHDMRVEGFEPNRFVLATGLNACSDLACLEEGEKIHTLRIKLSDEVDICVDNALIDMYAKCGFMDGAVKVFRLMGDRSVVSWTTMIMGFAQNGCARRALEMFDEMRSNGVEPSEITFVSVLYACSQGGYVREGWKHFLSMTKDYGIVPCEDHYACMVDLLGRAGLIGEAEELIGRMPPFESGFMVWKMFLKVCLVHGDVETSRRVAKKIVGGEEDPSIRVLASNVLASSGNWSDVEVLREFMEVKKVPASSWVRTKGLI
ncbi:putative pentatricopeptide repeat-containing protein At3g15130 [Impatiens glandulifera]|uniref:putative pentatricopeptide repeat-containing protein At3g15130 n=1 Tax=Impatiens glandulifera TaxID=253017 RepID=UPI001FB087E1|nr:putative pentatricopeptide repeat-containing protein At3g15130 [Impatiens glandulifera]